MRRAIPLSAVLILLPCCCPLVLGHFGEVTWPHWHGLPDAWRHAEQGPPDLHQEADAFQSDDASGVGSAAGQLIRATGLQLQSATDTQISQTQTGTAFVGQAAVKTGPAGQASSLQFFTGWQYGSASSAVGQATQTQSATVVGESHVAGAAGSTALAAGGVVVSMSQSEVVN